MTKIKASRDSARTRFIRAMGFFTFKRHSREEGKKECQEENLGETSRILMLICSGRLLEIEKLFLAANAALLRKRRKSQWQVLRAVNNKRCSDVRGKVYKTRVDSARDSIVSFNSSFDVLKMPENISTINELTSHPHDSVIRQDNFSLKSEICRKDEWSVFTKENFSSLILCLRNSAAESFPRNEHNSTFDSNTLPTRKHFPSIAREREKIIKLSCHYVDSKTIITISSVLRRPQSVAWIQFNIVLNSSWLIAAHAIDSYLSVYESCQLRCQQSIQFETCYFTFLYCLSIVSSTATQ